MSRTCYAIICATKLVIGGYALAIIGSHLSSAATVAYYKFDDGPNGSAIASVTDSGPNNLTGAVLSGATAPTYDASVGTHALASVRAANNLSAKFNSPTDALAFNYAFPFNTLTNATIEFWFKPTNSFWYTLWTTNSAGDRNRFNFFAYYQNPQSQLPGIQFCLDYREPGGEPA